MDLESVRQIREGNWLHEKICREGVEKMLPALRHYWFLPAVVALLPELWIWGRSGQTMVSPVPPNSFASPNPSQFSSPVQSRQQKNRKVKSKYCNEYSAPPSTQLTSIEFDSTAAVTEPLAINSTDFAASK